MAGRFRNLREIEGLDPECDCQRIIHISFGYEFCWDSTKALELGLYRTYCVPSISGLLDRTGEFHRHAQRRYDDTAILIAELCELDVFGFPRPLPGTRGLVDAVLRARRRIVRWLPPRRKPNLFTDRPNRTHPQGYEIDPLGPPRLVAAERKQTAGTASAKR